MLGVMLDDRGFTRAMVDFRLRAAQRVWGRLRHLLCSRSLEPDLRIRRFYQTVIASATYGAGLWNPTTSVYTLLDAQELRWVRAMTGLHRHRGEEWVPFYRRRKAAAERLRDLPGTRTPWTLGPPSGTPTSGRSGLARRRLVAGRTGEARVHPR